MIATVVNLPSMRYLTFLGLLVLDIPQLRLPLEACRILNAFFNQSPKHISRVNINRAQCDQCGPIQLLEWLVDFDHQIGKLALLLLPFNLQRSDAVKDKGTASSAGSTYGLMRPYRHCHGGYCA
jgi:hypothetical protein